MRVTTMEQGWRVLRLEFKAITRMYKSRNPLIRKQKRALAARLDRMVTDYRLACERDDLFFAGIRKRVALPQVKH